MLQSSFACSSWRFCCCCCCCVMCLAWTYRFACLPASLSAGRLYWSPYSTPVHVPVTNCIHICMCGFCCCENCFSLLCVCLMNCASGHPKCILMLAGVSSLVLIFAKWLWRCNFAHCCAVKWCVRVCSPWAVLRTKIMGIGWHTGDRLNDCGNCGSQSQPNTTHKIRSETPMVYGKMFFFFNNLWGKKLWWWQAMDGMDDCAHDLCRQSNCGCVRQKCHIFFLYSFSASYAVMRFFFLLVLSRWPFISYSTKLYNNNESFLCCFRYVMRNVRFTCWTVD